MKFLWFLGSACLLLVLVESQNDLFQDPKRGMGKLCGRHLTSVLSILCQGKYNKFMKKNDVSYNEIQGEDYEDQRAEELNWPFLPRESARALLARSEAYGRHRRGIVDECCKKSCSMAELQNYCADDNS